MKLTYNVTGTDRKSLVSAISQTLNAPTKYLGAPTFAYEVGGYHIDKVGTVTGKDNLDLENTLHQHGFNAVERDYNEPDTYESGLGGLGAVSAFEDLPLTQSEELGLGSERHDPIGEDGMQASDIPESFTYRAELYDPNCPDRMEVFQADSDEDAVKQALEFCDGEVTLLELHALTEDYEYIRGLNVEGIIAEANLYDTIAIEIPKKGMSDTQVKNLLKLVESKHTLLTKALGSPLKINDCGETLQFVFPYEQDNGCADFEGVGIMYGNLAAALVKYTKKHQRVTATEKTVESERFSLRTFLVKIGMNGIEYKATRGFLLRRLSGNSSFAQNASYTAMQESRKGGKGDE